MGERYGHLESETQMIGNRSIAFSTSMLAKYLNVSGRLLATRN